MADKQQVFFHKKRTLANDMTTVTVEFIPPPKMHMIICEDPTHSCDDSIVVFLSPPEPFNSHEQLFMNALTKSGGDSKKYIDFLNSIILENEGDYQRTAKELQKELGNEWEYKMMRRDSWDFYADDGADFSRYVRIMTSENHCIVHWL